MKEPLRFFGIAFVIVFIFSSFSYLDSPVVQGNVFRFIQALENSSAQVNLAAMYIAATEPDMKYVAVQEGLRKEEIAERFGDRLDWNEQEIQVFGEMLQCALDSNEGYLFPGGYSVPVSSTPEDVKQIMLYRFNMNEKEQIEKALAESSISLDKAIIVASLIQRESSGKRDMNLISGIIWNRLFSDMNLGIDATLQYIKGGESAWWPQVKSEDKDIDSPYNTYQNKGLPPGPISNPGIAAILAALNPVKTSCMYYLHDKYGRIHCSKTYAEHKRNINMYLK